MLRKICLLELALNQGFVDNFMGLKIADIGECIISVNKVLGDSPWHLHEMHDKFFMILKGNIKLQYVDNYILLGENEGAIIQKNSIYKLSAEKEAQILVFQPRPRLVS